MTTRAEMEAQRLRARKELVGSRGFIRAADTQLTKALAELDAFVWPEDPIPPGDEDVDPPGDGDVVDPDPVAPPLPDPADPDPDPVAPDPPPGHDEEPPPPCRNPRCKDPDGEHCRGGLRYMIGPQLSLNNTRNPWPWHDANLAAKAPEHAAAFLAATGTNDILNGHYYDLTLCLYTLHARSGDPEHLRLAREVGDKWADFVIARGNNTTPRNAAVSAVILRALDGRPELWQWVVDYTNHHLWNWIERRFDKENLHYGIRDGAYSLLGAAQVAATHPDEQVRADFLARSHRAATEYYLPRQHEDGGWYWLDSEGKQLYREDGTRYKRAQPFMHGLLLEALIAVYDLTSDDSIADAVVRCCGWLVDKGYRPNQTVIERPQYDWRGTWYFVWEPGAVLEQPPASPGDPRLHSDGVTCVAGTYSLRGGSDLNSIREARQYNVLYLHALGFAYLYSQAEAWKTWGDEIFAASYGNKAGPGHDGLRSLADFRAKEYSQCYRSAGRYLVWRL